MTAALRTATAALIAAVAVAGCGLGPGEGEGEGTATLTVTRDFGAEQLLEADSEDPAATETVVRFLDREAEIETSYGGNFVDAIDGVASRSGGTSREDWFFYVNGYWSPVGAGEAKVRAGDRIWWDYRAWEEAYRVPAVVGSWPEPFVHGFDGERFATEVVCFAGGRACELVRDRLATEGIDATPLEAGEPDAAADRRTLRVLVGPWQEVRRDPSARQLESGPDRSGVYASPRRCRGEWELVVVGPDAQPRAVLDDAAFVGAVARGEEQPSWIVSATDQAGVGAAAELLDEADLRNRYAVAATDDQPIPLPAAAESPPIEADC